MLFFNYFLLLMCIENLYERIICVNNFFYSKSRKILFKSYYFVFFVISKGIGVFFDNFVNL